MVLVGEIQTLRDIKNELQLLTRFLDDRVRVAARDRKRGDQSVAVPRRFALLLCILSTGQYLVIGSPVCPVVSLPETDDKVQRFRANSASNTETEDGAAEFK